MRMYLLLALLVVGAHLQAIVIRNTGCKSFDAQNICIECSNRYFLDSSAICQPVNPNCKTYNTTNGHCLSCYPGFGIIEDTCLPGIVSSNFDPNCAQFEGDVCIKCSKGFFPALDGKCKGVNPSCKTYDPSNGWCTSCYAGYEVQANGLCLLGQSQSAIANCNEIDPISGLCVKCSFGYYFDEFGQCRQIDPNCKSFDTVAKRCTECYPGKELDSNNNCVKSASPVVDPNCKTFRNNICIECSKGSIFNAFGTCITIDPTCKTYDEADGKCTSCYSGFELSPIRECVKAKIIERDPNCKTFRDEICIECSKGAIFNAFGVCITVDPSCKTFDEADGKCTSCYPGFELSAVRECVKAKAEDGDPNCKTFRDGICIECSQGAIFNSFGVCITVDPSCKTFDEADGKCTSCYPGFELSPVRECVKAKDIQRDPNCKTFRDNICIECSQGSIFNAFGVCITIDPTCKTYDEADGKCTSCYPGYELSEIRECIKAKQVDQDPNCKTFRDGLCIECSKGAIFNAFGVCITVDPSCKTFDEADGKCTSCYPGFELSAVRECVKAKAEDGDPNCRKFENNICIECSTGAFFNSERRCIQSNPACFTYNELNGLCTSCYPGFEVTNNGGCAKAKAQEGDPNCKTFRENVCIECSGGAVFNPFGVCITVDPSCLTFDQADGLCTSCYAGFALSAERKCLQSKEPKGDPNCKTFNNNVCTECSKGSIFNADGVCIIVDPSCLSFDGRDGSCTSCYDGFTVVGKACVLSNKTDTHDPFCKQFLAPDVCVECSNRYFINGFGICQEVNTLCNTYDQATGNCMSCYPGFELSGPACVKATSSVTDEYCKTWNGDICTECSFGAFFLPNGKCTLADPLCRTFDQNNGNCMSCYASFELQGAKCIKSKQSLSDPNCAEFFEGLCTKCSKGFIFLDNGKCGLVSPDCKNYNTLTGACTECYMGFVLESGNCIKSTQDNADMDPNCAAFQEKVCIKCSKNFYFGINGVCTAVDPLCNGYDENTGACTGCYESFVLIGPACVEDKNFQLTDPNCASWLEGICVRCATRTVMDNQGKCQNVNINCNTYNPSNGVCTSCYPGFELKEGNCQESVSASSCNKFNADGSCARCGKGSYLSQGRCIAIDPQCAYFDEQKLACTACYPGYSILNGACQISQVEAQFEIKNCYAYDNQNQCIKCFNRFFFEFNQCKPVNVFCKTYDEYNGSCLTCYTSFTLTEGKCVK